VDGDDARERTCADADFDRVAPQPSSWTRKEIVAISSGLGTTGLEQSTALARIRYAYRASKAALNNGMRALALDWQDDGILVGIIALGYVRTDMGGAGAEAHPTSISAEESAAALIRRISELSPSTSGTFQRYDGEAAAW
jgi:NAD(P)-dependent dehydrogenase (short-subunit alcohol dehydrogenase family)